MDEAQYERIIGAKYGLLKDFPFFGQLALYLRYVEDNKNTETLSTDGITLRYNSEYIKDKTMPQLMFLVTHEIMHCALRHIYRQYGKVPQIYNMAGDFVINYMLKSSGMEMPEGLLYSDQFKDMSAEEIYEYLLSKSEEVQYHISKSGGKPCGGMAKPGEHSGDMENSQGEMSDQIDGQTWAERLVATAEAQRQRGELPAGMERLLDKLLRPKKDWKTILQEFISDGSVDETFQLRDRRFQEGIYDESGIIQDIFIPGVEEEEKLEGIVCAVDTSGSVGGQELTEFMSEVKTIAEMGTKIYVVFCDAQTYNWQQIDGGFNLPPPQGGGGTDFNPVFKEIEKRDVLVRALVFFTDGYGAYPQHQPPYDTLWIMTTDYEPPWGRVVRYHQ